MTHDRDRRATQQFLVRDLLIEHTDQILTPGLIDLLVDKFKERTQVHWPMGWAFSTKEERGDA